MCSCLTCSVQLLEKTFTYDGQSALPEATFAAWQKLTEVVHACGQLQRRSQLLLNPITFALNSDKRPEVHLVSPHIHTMQKLMLPALSALLQDWTSWRNRADSRPD